MVVDPFKVSLEEGEVLVILVDMGLANTLWLAIVLGSPGVASTILLMMLPGGLCDFYAELGSEKSSDLRYLFLQIFNLLIFALMLEATGVDMPDIESKGG